MNKPAIQVENVSKRYVVNEHRPSLRQNTGLALRRLVGLSAVDQTVDPFWAVREVSFTIQPGECVGVVGRNGAGKSTLFRLIARITAPTLGRVTVNGRCAALIALGAGFNAELSGRDNIYLNAAMHGLSPRQVRALVEPIIDFSEIGTFIDLPVKRYSSGMAARLGFSVAVHILPEIILLDEVLSVGDAAFQEKCMTRMTQLKGEGRTIMLASHASGSLLAMCDRALWLDKGRLVCDDTTVRTLAAYQGAHDSATVR